jgi:hypothetical protein
MHKSSLVSGPGTAANTAPKSLGKGKGNKQQGRSLHRVPPSEG